jgi:transposase
LDDFRSYLQQRLQAWPELTGSRLLRGIRALGYQGDKTILNDCLRQIRPVPAATFEVRFETPPGLQAQLDFAEFKVRFAGKSMKR